MTADSDHPDIAASIEMMLSAGRMDTLDPFRVLSHCPIAPTDTVADIGCGPGYFTLPLAKYLINGRILGLDTSDEMVEACRGRLDDARLGNFEVLKCGEYEFPVAPASVDGLFISDVLHHTSDRVRFLTAAREMLKPGGWCFIIEWQKRETESGPPQEVRIDHDELGQLARDSGFRVQVAKSLNTDYHIATLINR